MGKYPLCRSCRNYETANYSSASRPNGRAYCKKFYETLTREATFCESYDDRRTPHINDMYRMAWILEKKNMVGFEGPVSEFNKPEKISGGPIDNSPV